MGSKRKYHENNSIGIMLLCGCVCNTSLGEIISCQETEPRAKHCKQSRHMMPEANQCRCPVLAGWNCATRHPERCSAWLRRLQAIPHRATANLDESLANGFDKPWTTWRCLNRLRKNSHVARNRDRDGGTT